MRASVWLIGALLLCKMAAGAEDAARPQQEEAPGATAEQQEAPGVRKIGPHLYAVGAVVVDARERTVRCRGRVNMNEGGPIELLACLPRGKTHESVFTLDLAPMDLQLALLLLDVQHGRNPSVEYPEDSPQRERPPGDEVLIFAEWREPSESGADESELRRCRAEGLLRNVEADRPMAECTWVFLGSRMVNDRFGADLDGSLITTYHDPLAILELALPTVNDDIYYFVNEDRCPPAGTPVELVIRALPKEKEQEGLPAASEAGEQAKERDQP